MTGYARREVLPRPHDGLLPGQWRLAEIPEGFVLTIRPPRGALFRFNIAWAVFWTVACFGVSVASAWSFAGKASLLMGAVLALLFASPGVAVAIGLATGRVMLLVDGPQALLMSSPSSIRASNYRTSHLDSLRVEPFTTRERFEQEFAAFRTYGQYVHADTFGPLAFEGFSESRHFGGDIPFETAEQITAAIRQRLSILRAEAETHADDRAENPS